MKNLNNLKIRLSSILVLLAIIGWSSSSFAQWQTSGSDIYFDGGNVGIETTSPVRTLHLGGIGNEDTGGPVIKLGTDIAGRNFEIVGNTGGPAIGFKQDNAATGDYLLTIRSAGDVGIGTASPSEKLEVVGKIKEGGIKLSYVPGQNELLLGKEKLAPVLAAAKILILNFHEAQSILGGGYSIKEMLVEFKKLGVGIPVITQDVEGSFAYDGKDFYHQEATPEVEVVDRTGAGDAFAATLTAGIILGKGIPESLLLAAKNASSEITKIGGTDGLLNLSQLESYQ